MLGRIRITHVVPHGPFVNVPYAVNLHLSHATFHSADVHTHKGQIEKLTQKILCTKTKVWDEPNI